ncbi:MAG: hypothetical protein WC632_05350 [Candidatus Margulisiibacteriota bacterium]
MKNKIILIAGCWLMAALFLAGQSWAVIPKIINVQGVLNPPVSDIPITFQINSTPIPTIPGPVTTDKAGYFNTSLDFTKLFPDPYGFPPPDVITILSNGKPVGDVTLTSVPYAFHSEVAERGIDGFTVVGRAAIGLGVNKANSSYALQIGDPAANFPGTNNMAVYGDLYIRKGLGESGKQIEKGLILNAGDPSSIYANSSGANSQALPIRLTENGANVMIGNASTGNLGIGTNNPLASIQVERDLAHLNLTSKNDVNGTFLQFRNTTPNPSTLARIQFLDTGGTAVTYINCKPSGALTMTSTKNQNGAVLELQNMTSNPSAIGAINFLDSANNVASQISHITYNGLSFFDNGKRLMSLTNGTVAIPDRHAIPPYGMTPPLSVGAPTKNDFAAIFWGQVYVDGYLQKAAGSFLIDHPLDPKNKILRHSFVESPDMKNIYDGIARLNDKGEATVQLPKYFEALNRDFRYQLTALGEFAPIFIKSKIKDNKFVIAGGKAGQEISWQVTGSRQDAFVKKHPLVIEEEKGQGNKFTKGKYLNPDAFGGKPKATGAR